jgi:hypothetical protein
MVTKELLQQTLDALIEAQSHLDYCGYGDSWERECAAAQDLEGKIQRAIDAAQKEL